jgi:hypothetical protein
MGDRAVKVSTVAWFIYFLVGKLYAPVNSDRTNHV